MTTIENLPSYKTIQKLCSASKQAFNQGLRKVNIGETAQEGDWVFNGSSLVEITKSETCTNPGKVFFTKRLVE